jgi:hypothetical protein
MDVAAVVDRDDRDAVAIIVDLVDHPEVPASRAVVTRELESKRSADLMWGVCQTAVHELDARSGDLRRQPVE